MLHEESALYLRKQRLRKLIREEWGRCSREELDKKSSSAVSALLNNRHVLAAHAVAIYSSLPDEVNTSDAIAKLMTMGKEVFLPVVISDKRIFAGIFFQNRQSVIPGTIISDPNQIWHQCLF